MGDRSLFFRRALDQCPRILGLMDREAPRVTFGSFDRPYWHYRTRDLSNARLQEGALLLAILHRSDVPGNRFFGKEAVRGWIDGAVSFWCRIQHRDGSFDEYYPNERSFVATAFSTYAVSEALLVADDAGLARAAAPSVERAGRWLARNGNPAVANQEAGALAALHNCFLLTGDPFFRSAAEARLSALLPLQQPDGWFPEYGGFDIGYLSVAVSYLMKHHRASGEERSLEAAARAAAFLSRRVRDDGRYDWEDTSRRTQYLYPHGLALLGSPVVDRILSGLASDSIVSPAWLDDTFCIPLAIDYMLAGLPEE